MAILAAHPDMEGVVFDQPVVAQVAESVIREQEYGNYMKRTKKIIPWVY